VKTVVQICMVSWWLLPWSDLNVGHWLWLVACLLFTLWSGIEYFLHAQRARELVG
jgi:phosphatidylglycerophosphate synthase